LKVRICGEPFGFARPSFADEPDGPEVISHLAGLPLDVAVLFLTIMARDMPLMGRGFYFFGVQNNS
jgi:hypothetical protein